MNPIKSLYRLKYGVRGALKPPLGPQRGFAYFWKFIFWKAENAVYTWTGLPDEWFKFRNADQSQVDYPINIHVIPVGGREPVHVASANCWCFPTWSDGVTIHNAKDCREKWERINAPHPGQFWVNVASKHYI